MKTPSARYVKLLPGDPAPWFQQRSTSNARYVFDTVGGRYIVLCFHGRADDREAKIAMAAILANRSIFDDKRACLFIVSIDPNDEKQHRLRGYLPGIRVFWDFDAKISRLYGAALIDAQPGRPIQFRRFWIVLDPMLRVMEVFPFEQYNALFDYLKGLPPPERFVGIDIPAPVLILPNVFEPDLCRQLISLYEAHGGEESGFMTDVGDKTVLRLDPNHKVRKDYMVEDPALLKCIHERGKRRIEPEILKVHHFKVTRIERHLVACYSAEDGGHFHRHRDNTTTGTAHRRFAVSINLNADFEGGDISFPEYGGRSFKPPAGGAVVFSCSLLHAVSVMTAGRRYAFLPFLYDDAAALKKMPQKSRVEATIRLHNKRPRHNCGFLTR